MKVVILGNGLAGVNVAQALRKLESADEQPILVELVRDYPDSPHAEAAKKRLRELAR